LDVGDENTAAGENEQGNVRIDHIETLGTAKDVFVFNDGYTEREAGEFTSYDVVLDQYDIILSQPQEGFASVTLREQVS